MKTSLLALVCFSILSLTTTPGSAQVSRRTVYLCSAPCVALFDACTSGFAGSAQGIARYRNAAFSRMNAQCQALAGGRGVLLTDIAGFRMERTAMRTVEERYTAHSHHHHYWHGHWQQYYTTTVVRWAEHCGFEIHGTPARAADDGVCEEMQVDDLDVPYTGTLPVLG